MPLFVTLLAGRMPCQEAALSGIAAAKAARMVVAAIPDTRFVDAGDYDTEADYVLRSLSEVVYHRRFATHGTDTFENGRLPLFSEAPPSGMPESNS
ncbi:MAG: hypothetical protein H0W20_13145 [Chthoniobacterales bacterium]|nr:hypothetical protein [Chthoniobacterales bacterium]